MEQEAFENRVQMTGNVVTDCTSKPSTDEPDYIRFMVSTNSGRGVIWVQIRVPVTMVGDSQSIFSKGNTIFLEGEIRESATKVKGTGKYLRRNYIWVTRFSQNPPQCSARKCCPIAAKEFEPVTNVPPGY